MDALRCSVRYQTDRNTQFDILSGGSRTAGESLGEIRINAIGSPRQLGAISRDWERPR